jgi:hypothetical protein
MFESNKINDNQNTNNGTKNDMTHELNDFLSKLNSS